MRFNKIFLSFPFKKTSKSLMKYYGKLSKSGETSFFEQVEAIDSNSARREMQQNNEGWKISGFGNYLVEAKIHFFLEQNFPDSEIIYDQAFSDKNNLTSNIKPDFRIESINLKGKEIKLIIEFDGAQHYTKALEVLKDEKKNELYKEEGYKVIRFPYYIQLSKEIVDHYFGEGLDFDDSYKHGFVDSKATLPSDFCEIGMNRFMSEIKCYYEMSSVITKSIVETLKEKIETKKRTNSKWSEIIPDSVIGSKYLSELEKFCK